MRWTAQDLADFQARRSFARPSGETITTASIRKPSAGRKRAAAPVASELQDHFALVGHLNRRAVPGVWWTHFPAGELRDAATGNKLARMGTANGVPDLLLIKDGRTYGLELKRALGGRLSADQRTTQAAMTAAGAICHTAHGLDEALTVLLAWGLIRPAADAQRTSTPTRQTEGATAHG
jgi:hypothetical protein